MATAMEHHVQLAQKLHPRLLAFFKRYPPQQIRLDGSSPSFSSPANSTTPQIISVTENTSSSDPSAAASIISVPLSSSETGAAPFSASEAIISKKFHNPFLPFRNPRTGNWHGPAFSLRRQAELYKLAAKHHVLSLMPISHKHPQEKERKRMEHGLRVQGTGVGKKVKGKAWERMLPGRLRQMESAMEGMPELIRSWKEKGHGRGWKKWPK